jgi:PAS domain S-box-containing protein
VVSRKKGPEGQILQSASGSQAEMHRPDPRPLEIESEARLRAIVDNAVDGIITIDEYGLILDFNPAAQRLFGYETAEVVGKNVKMLMPEPYRKEHDGYLQNYRDTGKRKIIGIGREVTGRRKDGTVFPLDLAVSEVQFGGRRLFTGIVRDVTERKRVEEERQRFVSLIENSSDFIAVSSLAWELLFVNEAGRELIGITPEKVVTTEVRDLWHNDTLPIVLGEALPTLQSEGSFRFQGKVRHFGTGEAIDVDCNMFGIRDAHTGDTIALAFAMRDIRVQKQREQALLDGEARIKGILDSAVDGIVTIDERGSIESVNPAAQRVFGYSMQELKGKNVKILMPEPYHGEHDQYLRNYRHTGQRKIIGIGREVVGRRKDGSTFPLDLAVSEVPLGDRRIFTGIIRDITDRKQADQHRNLLVAELSHRVKNTLASVISVAQQTFRHAQSFKESRNAFEGRIQALAHTHSRLAETNWAGASLQAVLLDEVAPYRSGDGANTRMTGPNVMLGPKAAVSLGMAFHELATNAAKYGALSSPAGSVEIEWGMLRPEDRQVRIRWTERGGPEVEPPTRSGFGRLLLERGLAHELKGKVQLDFAKEGLKCTIVFPLDGDTLTAGRGGS